jgi:hypothetical protein
MGTGSSFLEGGLSDWDMNLVLKSRTVVLYLHSHILHDIVLNLINYLMAITI